jgi:hypothetical protein
VSPYASVASSSSSGSGSSCSCSLTWVARVLQQLQLVLHERVALLQELLLLVCCGCLGSCILRLMMLLLHVRVHIHVRPHVLLLRH